MSEYINRTGKNHYDSAVRKIMEKFFPWEFVVDSIDTHAAFEASGLELPADIKDDEMGGEE